MCNPLHRIDPSTIRHIPFKFRFLYLWIELLWCQSHRYTPSGDVNTWTASTVKFDLEKQKAGEPFYCSYRSSMAKKGSCSEILTRIRLSYCTPTNGMILCSTQLWEGQVGLRTLLFTPPSLGKVLIIIDMFQHACVSTTTEVKSYSCTSEVSTQECTLVERAIIPALWGFNIIIISLVDIVVSWSYSLTKATY